MLELIKILVVVIKRCKCLYINRKRGNNNSANLQ